MLLAEERIAGTAARAYDTSIEPGEKLKFKKRPAKLGRIVVCLFLLISAIIVNLIFQSLLVLRVNEIQKCEAAIRNLEAQSIQIRIEMANLESFDRIQKLAQKELGMRVAGPNDYQCIAAAPSFERDLPKPYGYIAETGAKPNLWAKLTTWLGSMGETMAQNP